MKVSVIIPVYNKKDYIEECIQSCLQQDFDSFEVIAVDDGSTDGSGEICDKIAESDSRLKVFHVKNGGVTAARRYGAEHSSGEYLMFVDSDDGLLPGAINRLYKEIEKTKSRRGNCRFQIRQRLGCSGSVGRFRKYRTTY